MCVCVKAPRNTVSHFTMFLNDRLQTLMWKTCCILFEDRRFNSFLFFHEVLNWAGGQRGWGGLWPTKTPPPSRVNVPAFFNCWQAVTLPCFCRNFDDDSTIFRHMSDELSTSSRRMSVQLSIHSRLVFRCNYDHFRSDLNKFQVGDPLKLHFDELRQLGPHLHPDDDLY